MSKTKIPNFNAEINDTIPLHPLQNQLKGNLPAPEANEFAKLEETDITH